MSNSENNLSVNDTPRIISVNEKKDDMMCESTDKKVNRETDIEADKEINGKTNEEINEGINSSDEFSDDDETYENGSPKKKSSKEGSGKGNGFRGILPKLLSLLAAILVWFYVSGSKSVGYEKEFFNIPVTFDALSTIEKLGYTIVSGEDAVVNVTVNGTRSDVNRIKLDDIVARCDLSGILGSGEYTLPIISDSPGSTAVTSITPASVTVYIDKSTRKSVPIVAGITSGGTNDLSIKIEEPQPYTETVNISGPVEALEKIDHAAVDIALDGLIDRSTEWTGEIYLVDNSGQKYSNPYVKLDRTTVKVLVPVNKYKTVPISVSYDGPTAQELGHDVTLSFATLEIRGSKDIVDDIERIETEPVDISNVRGATAFSSSFSVPDGIEITQGQPTSVDISIVPHNNNKKTIVTPNIAMINIPQGFTATADDQALTIDFYGTNDAVSRLTPENVYAVADLSGCIGAGNYTVALSISYPDIDGVRLPEGKTYTADITISR